MSSSRDYDFTGWMITAAILAGLATWGVADYHDGVCEDVCEAKGSEGFRIDGECLCVYPSGAQTTATGCPEVAP